MLWAPVTYEADARHTLWVWWLLARPAKPWYGMLATGIPVAEPTICCTTGMNGGASSAPAGV